MIPDPTWEEGEAMIEAAKEDMALAQAPKEPAVRTADHLARIQGQVARGERVEAQPIQGPEPEAPVRVHVDPSLPPTNSWDLE
jgi:hypothetical protein